MISASTPEISFVTTNSCQGIQYIYYHEKLFYVFIIYDDVLYLAYKSWGLSNGSCTS